MDFVEFTKSGESFVVMLDKYSGALHAGGVKKGGTGDETINNSVSQNSPFLNESLYLLGEAVYS